MTHRDRVELLLAYHAGSLDEPQAAEVRALLAGGDPTALGASVEAVEVLARLAATVEPIAPRPELRGQLLAGLQNRPAAGGNSSTPTDPVTPSMRLADAAPPARPAGFPRLRLAAAVLIAFGLTAYVVNRSMERAALQQRAESAENAARDTGRRITQLEQTLAAAQAGDAAAQSALAAMYSPEARFGVLNPAAGDTAKRQGRVIVDPSRRQLQAYVFDLAAPPPGRTYQLWLLPENGAPIPAPVFSVDAAGKAYLTVPLPAGVSAISGAAVSEEAAGGSRSGAPEVVKLVGKAG